VYNKIKITIKNALIYSIGNISNKIVGLLLLPIYLNKFSTTEYGIIGIIEITIQVLVAVLGLGLYNALVRWYWDKKYIENQKSMFFTCFIFLFLVNSLIAFSLLPFSDIFAGLLFKDEKYSYLINLMLITTGLQILSIIPSSLLQVQGKPLLFSISHIFNLIVSMTLTIFLILKLNKGIEAIYEAQIIGYLSYFLFLARYIFKNSKIKFEIGILKEMLAYSYPLILSAVSGFLLIIADRYCLNYLASLSEVGIYTLGFKIANTIKVFVVTSIQLAVSPLIFKMVDEPDNKRFYSKMMTYFSFVVIFFVMGFSLFGKELIKLLANNIEYWEAYKIIPFISLAIFFSVLNYHATLGFIISKKTKIVASLVIIMSLINLLFNLLLVPYFKAIGAAIATLATQIVYFLLSYIIVQKVYYIPYEIPKIMKLMTLGLVLILFSLFMVDQFPLFVRIAINSLFILAFPFLLYPCNFYEMVELERIKKIWSIIRQKIF
jgi:O-antigen/teichoic acid export membrane protein